MSATSVISPKERRGPVGSSTGARTERCRGTPGVQDTQDRRYPGSHTGTTTPKPERAAIAFFGIRGIGSLYYLAYAVEHAEFPNVDRLWALVAFTVVVSILVHGTSATLVTRRLDARREEIGRTTAKMEA